MGMDFKGKTSSAVTNQPISERVAGISSRMLEVFSSIVDLFSDFSVEIVGSEISIST